jgi:hypothetical protein
MLNTSWQRRYFLPQELERQRELARAIKVGHAR